MTANSGTTVSTTSMRERLDEVLARIDKELQRADSASTTAGTTYVGGVTRLGASLEAYLLEVWRWANVRLRRDPEEVARRSSPPVLLDRVTAGQLLYLLSTLVGSAIANEPQVRCVIAEARDGSSLERALALRNAIVHGRTTPDVETIRATLARLRDALAPQRALLDDKV
jgi:hypothetical protein